MFRAPEQFHAERPTTAADMYSYGMLAWCANPCPPVMNCKCLLHVVHVNYWQYYLGYTPALPLGPATEIFATVCSMWPAYSPSYCFLVLL